MSSRNKQLIPRHRMPWVLHHAGGGCSMILRERTLREAFQSELTIARSMLEEGKLQVDQHPTRRPQGRTEPTRIVYFQTPRAPQTIGNLFDLTKLVSN